MTDSPDIQSRRLAKAEIEANFQDIKPPLNGGAAVIEASRCYFCYDAPCIPACPTAIDIPGFIRKITTGNVRGSALDILDANIFGGMCARVCPTEILCEQACVRNGQEHQPVRIGQLQRYSTDAMQADETHPFVRDASSGNRVAVVGAGPAGLSCAHRLARLGHEVVVYEARDKGAGLNEYGIAAYKVPDDFAQKEIAWILDVGGIEVKYGQALGSQVNLADLRKEYDAVFIGAGLAAVHALEVEGADADGVISAVDYIARLRQADDLGSLAVGRRVVVIGGGNTAIDIAIQSKRLGAQSVTMVYRRGPDEMGATWHEREFAQTNGVQIQYWAQPKRNIAEEGQVTAVIFEYTELDENGRLKGTGETYTLQADVVFPAIGQALVAAPFEDGATQSLRIENGRIVVDEHGATSLRDVYAGGDCVKNGDDLTVQAVQDGKIAALAIDLFLRG